MPIWASIVQLIINTALLITLIREAIMLRRRIKELEKEK